MNDLAGIAVCNKIGESTLGTFLGQLATLMLLAAIRRKTCLKAKGNQQVFNSNTCICTYSTCYIPSLFLSLKNKEGYNMVVSMNPLQ